MSSKYNIYLDIMKSRTSEVINLVNAIFHLFTKSPSGKNIVPKFSKIKEIIYEEVSYPINTNIKTKFYIV